VKSSFWRAAALCLFLCAALTAEAEWEVTSSIPEPSPNDKVEHWTTVVADNASGAEAILESVVFETRAATLRVIDQPKRPRRELAETMAESRALAGVNGGYFDPEDAPVGLLVSDGQTISRLGKAKLLSGVLSTSRGRIEIVRAGDFSMNAKIQTAVQCGPLLVERGNAVGGLNDRRTARRTFAAIDGKGRAMLGVSSAVTLAQLGQILSLTNSAAKMKISRALNLDGGSSSAFWFRGAPKNFSIPELKTVRDFVAIVPRKAR
jgi:uncharacterized protein YigE (DUF2233 family)